MHVLFYRRNFWGVASGGDQQLVNFASWLTRAGHRTSVVVKYPTEKADEYTIRLAQNHIPIHAVTPQRVFRAVQFARRCRKAIRRRLWGAFPDGPEIPPPPADATPQEREEHFRAQGSLRASWDEETATNVTCRQLFRRLRPDVIQVIDLWQNLEPIRQAHALGIPVLYQDIRAPQDAPAAQALQFDYHLTMKVWYQKLAELLPLCAGVATLSPRLAALFRERVGYQGPVYVIPLIVEGPASLPARPRSSGEGVTFGYAARLEVLKGLLVLLDAWARLLKQHPRAALKIAGDGPEEERAHALAESLGLTPREVFTGVFPFEEKSAFLQSLDVFVLPSFTEGTPNGIIEAMAHGLPIVATNVGGIPDVVTPDCGILVPPKDPEALAHALQQLAADPDLRLRMGRAARARYERFFSPPAVLPLLVQTYADVVRRAGKGAQPPANGSLLHPWARVPDWADRVID